MIRSVRDRATFLALSRARRFRNGPVWLRSAVCEPGSGDGESRVAFAVPRSVGNAVERNRVRRRIRAAIAERAGDLEGGRAYLFGADRRVLHAPYSTIQRAVGELLRAVREVSA